MERILNIAFYHEIFNQKSVIPVVHLGGVKSNIIILMCLCSCGLVF